MTRAASEPARRSRLIGWLGWAGLDAIGRLALMTGSTIILSRILSPRDFGVAALVLAIVASAAIFVGAPFEEALAQRRHLRMAHLKAALGMSWLVGTVLFAGSLVGGHYLAAGYGEENIRYFLPVAMASIFFSGHSDIVTALARRLRRFNDVAYATLIGHVVGIGLSLVIAFLGYGAWALIAQRLFVVVIRAIVLQWCIGFVVVPGWSRQHLGDLRRFAGTSFLSRLTDNLTYLVFNNLVQAFYGLTVLGHVNMAMRLIEPIRGAIVATGHNIAFSFLARAGRDSARLRLLAQGVVSQAALVTVPVFVGMAVVAPVLLPLVAGPGWEDAIMIAVCLSLASAAAVPAGLIYTTFSADARPELNLISLVASFAGIVVTLLTLSSLGPISVGVSRIVGDLIRTAFAIGFDSRRLTWSRRQRLDALLPAWLLAATMGLAIVAAHPVFPKSSETLHLIAMVSLGMVIYAVLLALFARKTLAQMASHLPAMPGVRKAVL